MTPGDAIAILVVEDEPMVRRLIEVMLKVGTYRILIAGDGMEALGISRACTDRIHLLFSDVDMPGISGIELAHTLIRERPGIYILLTSADPGHAAETSLPFLCKPFTRDVLLAKVRRVLDSDAPRSAAAR